MNRRTAGSIAAPGVPERWARAFEGIYQEPPRWYVSDGGVDTFGQGG
ncbi:MAG: hypothetical protein H6Q83_2051, partial [Deltaproteobacteria bacterium]|nr:hypothetical protein [Deltaproteobacteria bacterium]